MLMDTVEGNAVQNLKTPFPVWQCLPDCMGFMIALHNFPV